MRPPTTDHLQVVGIDFKSYFNYFDLRNTFLKFFIILVKNDIFKKEYSLSRPLGMRSFLTGEPLFPNNVRP